MSAMINKPQIYALVIISVFIFFLFSYFTGLNTVNDWAKLISALVSVIGLLITIFVKFLWKMPILYPWFCEVPNLNGIWEAEIKSNATPNTIQTQKGIEIKQSYRSVDISFETGESRSETITANFVKTIEGYKLIYVFRNEPSINLRKHSQIHYGAVNLHWNEKHTDVLEGHYWTDRETTGSMYLVKE